AAEHGLHRRPAIDCQGGADHRDLGRPYRWVAEVHRYVTRHADNGDGGQVRARGPEPGDAVSQRYRLAARRHHKRGDLAALAPGGPDPVPVADARRIELPADQAVRWPGHTAPRATATASAHGATAVPDRSARRHAVTPAPHIARNITYTIAVRSS